MDEIIFTTLGLALLLWLLTLIPEPHHHEWKRVQVNPKLSTHILLHIEYGDTMQVQLDTRKHIPYDK